MLVLNMEQLWYILRGFQLKLQRIEQSRITWTNVIQSDIAFITSIEDDLKRRDFTMNAMAYQPLTETLIDPFVVRRH